MTQVKFPTTQNEMREAIRIAIATYSQTTVKNENKLNEALAKSLGAAEYNDIAQLEKDTDNDPVPYDVEFDYEGTQQLIINGQRIDTDLTHNEIVDYTVIDRQDRIEEIERLIGERHQGYGNEADLPLMRNVIAYLNRSSAQWVLESMRTNHFIAPDLDPKEFNDTCDKMIADAREHYKEQVGELSKTGDIIGNASTYYGGEDVDVFEGELVLLKEDRLGDEELPHTMPAYKYNGTVPEGYIAAYRSSCGEYVPLEFGGGSDDSEPLKLDNN